MPKIYGRSKIKVNGMSVDCLPGTKFTLGGEKKTSVMSSTGRAGSYSEMTPGKITFTAIADANLDPKALAATTDGVMTLEEIETKRSWVMTSAECVSDVEVSDGGAGIPFTFEGDEIEPL
ncbi:MAG: phage tail tube protein [Myxococcales bacterium]|jgi:hypothetical protein|nr:phage tail tube protein [Myxococcales bacterium]